MKPVSPGFIMFYNVIITTWPANKLTPDIDFVEIKYPDPEGDDEHV